jgi:hypothetical protein
MVPRVPIYGMYGSFEWILISECHGDYDQEMTTGEANIFLVFLVLIGLVCALIEHRLSRSDTSNGLPPRLDPDSLQSNKSLD